MLRQLTGARYVELFLGSGTLANEVVAAQLSTSGSFGLILSNGEFGERLIDHANRFRLRFEVLQTKWGGAFDHAETTRLLDQNKSIRWIWCTHCETSTGVLNDIQEIADICQIRDIKLCLDCISSIGTVPVKLENVHLASGVSGKGLASYPGLAMVFYNHALVSLPDKIPRYLDLGYYAEKNGVPFTSSSNLLYALNEALRRLQYPERSCRIAEISNWLRPGLRNNKLRLIGEGTSVSPSVITIELPSRVQSVWVGDRLADQGYLVSYKSSYLVKRNWIQFCLFGELSIELVSPILDVLVDLLPESY
jgi:aspartate aminotransferase-like enzyme